MPGEFLRFDNPVKHGASCFLLLLDVAVSRLPAVSYHLQVIIETFIIFFIVVGGGPCLCPGWCCLSCLPQAHCSARAAAAMSLPSPSFSPAYTPTQPPTPPKKQNKRSSWPMQQSTACSCGCITLALVASGCIVRSTGASQCPWDSMPRCHCCWRWASLSCELGAEE